MVCREEVSFMKGDNIRSRVERFAGEKKMSGFEREPKEEEKVIRIEPWDKKGAKLSPLGQDRMETSIHINKLGTFYFTGQY